MLPTEKNGIEAGELLLCLNESIEGLSLYNVKSAVNLNIKESISPKSANLIYDLFEAVIEESLENLSCILLFAEKSDNKLIINISVSCDSDLTALSDCFKNLETECDEDGIRYITLSLKEGDNVGLD